MFDKRQQLISILRIKIDFVEFDLSQRLVQLLLMRELLIEFVPHGLNQGTRLFF